jgi:hypothetical protein
MFCERTHAAPAVPAAPDGPTTLCFGDAPSFAPALAIYPDPEDACAFCDGQGFVRHRGGVCQMCSICEGVCATGVFVVQVETTRFVHELSTYQTRSMVAARRRADLRALALIRTGGLCFGYKVLAVNVVYRSPRTRARGETVATVPLVAPAPVAA